MLGAPGLNWDSFTSKTRPRIYASLVGRVKDQLAGSARLRLDVPHSSRSRSRSSASTPPASLNVDVKAKRNEMPQDYLSQMKMAYLDEP